MHRIVLLVLMAALSVLAPGVRCAEPPMAALELRPEARAAGFSAYTLPNGFKIILVPFATASTARAELVIKTGSLVEGYGETGMAHLLEHMLFKSAGARADIKSDLTRLGARWNATTTADRTSFSEVFPADPDALDEAIRIEADRFQRASFTSADLASEITVVRNELEQSEADAASRMLRAIQHDSFFWHGYARPTIGARSDIESATAEALHAFYRRHYRPDNAFLVVSGGFDPSRALAVATAVFSEAQNPPIARAASHTRDERRAATSISEVYQPSGKTMAMSAWKIPGPYDHHAIALALGTVALCSPEWGSLHREVVAERKVAVAAGCFGWDQREAGLFGVTATGDAHADAVEMSRVLSAHVENAAAKGITRQALERAREEVNNSFLRAQKSHESIAAMLSSAEVAGDWRLAFWQNDIVKTLAADDVNRALRTWLVATNRSDALLRHAESQAAPELPKVVDAAALVAGKDWPAVATRSDPLPKTAADLAGATVAVPLGDARVQAALIPRKTQGDLAWLVFANDFGNERALRDRGDACRMASALLRYGGAGLDRGELDAKMESLQANWDLGLGRITIEAPRANIEAALAILLAVWADPAMPAAEFERMKVAAIAGGEAALEDPVAIAFNLLEKRFDNYPHDHPKKPSSIEEDLTHLRAMSFEEVKACQKEFGGIAHVRLAMAGDFTPSDVAAVWERIARLPVSSIAYERVKDLAAPEKVDTSRIVVARGHSTDAVVAGKAKIAVSDTAEDFPALRLAVKILGDGSDSRIWRGLRESNGLAYEAGAMLAGSPFEARSDFELSASATGENAESALTRLQEELARALRDGFTEEEVERAKQLWTRERAMYAGNEPLYAARLAQVMLNGRDFTWLARYDARIARVSASDATAALRKYVGAAQIVWVIGKGNSS